MEDSVRACALCGCVSAEEVCDDCVVREEVEGWGEEYDWDEVHPPRP